MNEPEHDGGYRSADAASHRAALIAERDGLQAKLDALIASQPPKRDRGMDGVNFILGVVAGIVATIVLGFGGMLLALM